MDGQRTDQDKAPDSPQGRRPEKGFRPTGIDRDDPLPRAPIVDDGGQVENDVHSPDGLQTVLSAGHIPPEDLDVFLSEERLVVSRQDERPDPESAPAEGDDQMRADKSGRARNQDIHHPIEVYHR